MFGMDAVVTGSPDPFEQPPQHIAAGQRDHYERSADRQMLTQRGL